MNAISIEVPPEFVDHCAAYGLSPTQVLLAFMADLGETANSNGSDERARALSWFDRVMWPEEEMERAPQKDLLGRAEHVDINFGVDYEVVREVLNGIAGLLWREYQAIKATGSPDAVEQARAAYVEAQERYKSLSLNDHETIRTILGR